MSSLLIAVVVMVLFYGISWHDRSAHEQDQAQPKGKQEKPVANPAPGRARAGEDSLTKPTGGKKER